MAEAPASAILFYVLSVTLPLRLSLTSSKNMRADRIIQ
jgi:hypothetical protein